jgi:alpha 1,2-mannosyltransferase
MITVVQWGLTPASERNNVDYHPPAAFLHTILAKHRYNLQAPKLFSHIRRPRLDGIMEPTLVRTLYEFTGDCFALTLKGPDGLPGSENSMLDGQGVIMTEMPEVLGGKGPVWEELSTLADVFVKINVPGDR